MILVDTGPLLALCDPKDSQHGKAVAEMERLSRFPLAVCDPVMSEAWYLLRTVTLRRRLDTFVAQVPLLVWVPEDPELFRREVLDWLERYADQEPDWADGFLVVAAAQERASKVWTFDSEFRTIWRRPDGSHVPLAMR